MGRGTGRGREGEIGDSERKEKEDVKELEEKGEKEEEEKEEEEEEEEKEAGYGRLWVAHHCGAQLLIGGSHYTATLDCPSFYSQPIIISFFFIF